MERPDLKGHYGGWQALDAMPQEPRMAPLQQSLLWVLSPWQPSRKGRIKGEYDDIVCITLLLWLL